MQSHLDRKSTFDPNTSEAVNNIIRKTLSDIETTEDKPGVVEVARRKFLILFKEGSDQYLEAHARLLHTTELHLLAHTMQEAYELEDVVDERVASSPEPDILSKVEGVFPILLGKAQTLKELDTAFDECEGYIYKFVISKRTRFPFFKRIQLKFKLIWFYEVRKDELKGQSYAD